MSSFRTLGRRASFWVAAAVVADRTRSPCRTSVGTSLTRSRGGRVCACRPSRNGKWPRRYQDIASGSITCGRTPIAPTSSGSVRCSSGRPPRTTPIPASARGQGPSASTTASSWEPAGPARQLLPHSRWPRAFHLSQLLPTGCALGLQWRAARTRRPAVTIVRHR